MTTDESIMWIIVSCWLTIPYNTKNTVQERRGPILSPPQTKLRQLCEIQNDQICSNLPDTQIAKFCSPDLTHIRYVHPAHIGNNGTWTVHFWASQMSATNTLDKPELAQFAVGWHVAMLWPACSSDLGSRSGPSKCHHSTQYVGQVRVSGTVSYMPELLDEHV